MPLLSKREFIELGKANWQRVRPLVLRWRWVMGATVCLVLVAIRYMKDHPTKTAVLFVVGSMVSLLAEAFALLWQANRQTPVPAILECPACARKLPALAGVALASNRCGLCGGVVFADNTVQRDDAAGSALTAKLTKSEFLQRLRGFRKEDGLFSLKLVLSIMVPVALVAWSEPNLPEISPPLSNFLGGTFCVGMLGVLIWLFVRRNRGSRAWGLRCPCCDTDLSYGESQMNACGPQIAVASGHCPQCAAKVFADEPRQPHAPDKQPALTKAEFIERHQHFQKKGKRCGNLLAASMFGFLFFGLFASYFQRSSPQRGGWIEGCCLLFAFLPFVPALWYLHRQKRRLGLRCPACAKNLSDPGCAPITIATGRCGFCGEPVFMDAPPPR